MQVDVIEAKIKVRCREQCGESAEKVYVCVHGENSGLGVKNTKDTYFLYNLTFFL